MANKTPIKATRVAKKSAAKRAAAKPTPLERRNPEIAEANGDAPVQPKYDAAISFLVRDVATAQAIYDRLVSSELKVFFFPRNQEDLAETNGLESMREPFFHARIAVVLFTAPWGETPWTRVEATAIQERCLKKGWESLVFVQLDTTSQIPRSVPPTHVRFDFEQYGVDQLVGAIKLRIQEQGGKLLPPDAMTEAKRVASEATYLRDRERLLRDRAWIENTVHRAVRETMQELCRLAQEANSQHGFQIVCGAKDRICVMRSGLVSFGVDWEQPIFNNVGRDTDADCYLLATEFSGGINLPDEYGYFIRKPKKLKEHRFYVEVAHDRTLVWLGNGKKERVHPSQLADRLMRLFFDLISCANQGKGPEAGHFLDSQRGPRRLSSTAP
jgi:hypothetical protein